MFYFYTIIFLKKIVGFRDRQPAPSSFNTGGDDGSAACSCSLVISRGSAWEAAAPSGPLPHSAGSGHGRRRGSSATAPVEGPAARSGHRSWSPRPVPPHKPSLWLWKGWLLVLVCFSQPALNYTSPSKQHKSWAYFLIWKWGAALVLCSWATPQCPSVCMQMWHCIWFWLHFFRWNECQ